MSELRINETQINNTITTLEIAEMMEINHWEVLRKLEGNDKMQGIIPVLNDNNFVVDDYFIKSTYIDAKGEERPCYDVTKLGCDFLANKFTGTKGILFTAKYVKRFDEMEKELQSKQFKLPMTYKEALLQLVAKEEENEKLQIENKHKQEVINGLVDDVDVYKKRAIINRVCKKTSKNDYADRYTELYKCFCETYHIDLKARCEGYNMKQTKKKDELTVIGYAEKFGHIDTLYQCCVKLYEADVKKTIEELNSVQ